MRYNSRLIRSLISKNSSRLDFKFFKPSTKDWGFVRVGEVEVVLFSKRGEFLTKVAGGDGLAAVGGVLQPFGEQLEEGIAFERECGLFAGEVVKDSVSLEFDVAASGKGERKRSKIRHA